MELLSETSGDLTGDEIQKLVGCLSRLFGDFISTLGEYDEPLTRSRTFLTNFTRSVDEALLSFDGWLDLSQVRWLNRIKK